MLENGRGLLLFLASAGLLAGGCGAGAAPRPVPGPEADAPAAQAPSAGSTQASEPPPSDPGGTLPAFVDGERVGVVTPEGAERRGLTLVDLGQQWTPAVFREDPSLGPRGAQPYRRRLLRLADEAGRRARRSPQSRYLELYGIFPTFRVLLERMADDERHACHDAVEDGAIGEVERALRPGVDVGAQRRRLGGVRVLTRRLQRVAARRGLAGIDGLADDRTYGPQLSRLARMRRQVDAIRAVQAHLRCEGFLHERARDGVFDGWTGYALRAWQHRHMIISLGGRLDEATRASLLMDSRELDFLSVLRALRERVIDATGLIEDGSALGAWGTVLGRRLDLDDEFRWVERFGPMDRGAPDLVSEAAEAAAQALGWTDPDATRAWLQARFADAPPTLIVALPLPELPPYHGPHMELRAEIDRGDVWYRFPYTDDGRPRGGRVVERPTLVLYAMGRDGEHALVRWNTTIGGWQPEVNPEGGVGLRYKASDVGPRVWRDLIASPAWLPPTSTPDDELLRRRGEEWRVHRSITGPGYDSAYGLAMFIHHGVRGGGGEGEAERWFDNGIRSHGSVNYRSILRGYSHGCHRLFNHLAVRLTSFVLAHREHVVHGRVPANFVRELHPEGAEQPLTLTIDTRGYRFELTPPVPVEVLEGRIRGGVRRPPYGFYPLPEELRAQAEEEIAADPDPGASAADGAAASDAPGAP